MRFYPEKYFEEAKKLNIDPYQLSYSASTETTVEVFNGEVESQTIGTSQDISAKGIYEGKQGSFGTDAIDSLTPSLMANRVYESALFGKEAKAEDYFKGGLKYKKAKTVSKDFKPATLKDLRHFAMDLYKEVKSRDKRLSKISISVSMTDVEARKYNSYGVKCSDKAKLFYGYIELVAENEDKEPRSSGKGFYSFYSLEDLKVHALKIIDEAIHAAVDFFSTGAAVSNRYPVVLSRSSVSALLGYYLGQFNAKSVQKHLSVFEGKMNTKIASDCLTMKATPHVMSPGSSSYDADGYPTQDFTFLDQGVLKDYFYSVETANVDHRQSNGCCVGDGNGMPAVVSVTPGKDDVDGLLSRMKDGLYITSLSGLNAGINGQTLEFSLPCEGYFIKDGKKEKAFSMTMVVGNLQDVFNSILAVGNDIEPDQGIYIPSMLVSRLAVSGK